MIKEFRFSNYEIVLEARREGVLPYHHGTLIKGLIKNSLRMNYCDNSQEGSCENCTMLTNCDYAKLLDKSNGIAPFVINPMNDGRRVFKKGDTLRFQVVMFSPYAMRHASLYVYSIRRAESAGLGPERVPFSIREILNGVTGKPIEMIELLNPANLHEYHLEPKKNTNYRKLEIIFKTPTKLAGEDGFTMNFDFHLIIRDIMDKARAISLYYGSPMYYDHQTLMKESETVEIRSQQIQWKQLERLPSPGENIFSMGGVIGNIVFEGNLANFVPWLEFARVVHVGKNTTAGCGWIDVEYIQD